MLGDAAADRHGQPHPGADHLEDLRAVQLELLLQGMPSAAGGGRGVGRGQRAAKAQRGVQAEGGGLALEAGIVQ